MTDPLSLAVIGGVVLAEGIKFLYGQAGELLNAWRKRKEQKAAEEIAELPPLRPAEGVLAGTPDDRRPDPAELERLEEQIREARRALTVYADEQDPRPIDPKNPQLLADVDRLRVLLEAVYGEAITFKGESREPSGTTIDAAVVARRLRDSTATAVRNAGLMREGTDVRARADAEDLDRSHVTAVDFGGSGQA